MRRVFFTFVAIFLFAFNVNSQQKTIKVAVFAWLPDMNNLFDQIEIDFEEKNPEYDLKLRAIDPYADNGYGIFSGLNDFHSYDIVEIDYYRFSNIFKNSPPSIDKLPEEINLHDDYVGAATKINKEHLPYFTPHWICGNQLVLRKRNEKLKNATSFDDILKALTNNSPLNVDFYGSTTLGEYYADAALDTYGSEFTRAHLIEIGKDKSKPLNAQLIKKLKLLYNEINPKFKKKIDEIHDFSYLYPEDFYTDKSTSLLGYSERMYYVENQLKEIELIAWDHVQIDESELIVKQFSFDEESKGTPSWVDGFVIPSGKIKTNKDGIVLFLNYILSDQTYKLINKKDKFVPAKYLMPAYKSAFDAISTESPLMIQYLKNQDNAFLIDDINMYKGIKRAGKEISKLLI